MAHAHPSPAQDSDTSTAPTHRWRRSLLQLGGLILTTALSAGGLATAAHAADAPEVTVTGAAGWSFTIDKVSGLNPEGGDTITLTGSGMPWEGEGTAPTWAMRVVTADRLPSTERVFDAKQNVRQVKNQYETHAEVVWYPRNSLQNRIIMAETQLVDTSGNAVVTLTLPALTDLRTGSKAKVDYTAEQLADDCRSASGYDGDEGAYFIQCMKDWEAQPAMRSVDPRTTQLYLQVWSNPNIAEVYDLIPLTFEGSELPTPPANSPFLFLKQQQVAAGEKVEVVALQTVSDVEVLLDGVMVTVGKKTENRATGPSVTESWGDNRVFASFTVPAGTVPGEHTVTVRPLASTATGQIYRHTFTVTAGEDTEPGTHPDTELTDPVAASSGSLDWGIRQSFRNYVGGGGTITVSEGATKIDSGFAWSNGTGSYVPSTRDAQIRFDGKVNFYHHNGLLDLTISKPRVQLDEESGAGSLWVRAEQNHGGTYVDLGEVRLATLSLSNGEVTVDGNTVTYTGVEAAFTAEGAAVFGGDYSEGGVVDPLNFSFTIDRETAGIAPEPGPAAPGTGDPEEPEEPTTAAPAITTSPASVTVTAGADATFTAAASGTPAPTVQWQSKLPDAGGWVNIPDATTASYTAVAVPESASGTQYRAVFTNSAGTVESAAATLTVEPLAPTDVAPVVSTQPASVSVTAGGDATFTAAATETPVPTVNWQSKQGGGEWVDIEGATAPTYTATAVAESASGTQYRAVFTNTAGSAESDAATLTVTAAPGTPGDPEDPENPEEPEEPTAVAPAVTTQPASVTVAAGATATFTAAASGTPVPSVQWQSKVGVGSWVDIEGATAPTYAAASVAESASGTQYRAVFTNAAGDAQTNAATLTVTPAGDPGLPETGGDPSEDDLTPGNSGSVTVPDSVVQGGTVTVNVGTGHAGEQVDVYVFSSPVHLGTHTVSTAGTVTVTVPSGLAAGTHRIAVYAANGSVIGWDSITVTSAGRLASTGAEIGGTVAAAIVLLLTGAGAFIISARRRRMAARP